MIIDVDEPTFLQVATLEINRTFANPHGGGGWILTCGKVEDGQMVEGFRMVKTKGRQPRVFKRLDAMVEMLKEAGVYRVEINLT